MEKVTEVIIDNNTFPKVIIADEENDLLCQYTMVGNKKVEANVYFDHNLFVTIVLKEQNAYSKAILNAFSLRDVSDISKLIGFIDMTLSKEDGIITYNCEDFPKYVMSAMERGGYYPAICKDRLFSDELSQYTGMQPSLIKIIKDKFSRNEKFKELQNDIEKHFVSVIYADSKKTKEVSIAQESCECNEPNYAQAYILSEGWKWLLWDDGSGYLIKPDGEKFFEYDLCTVPGSVEYKETSNHQWSSFNGTFEEFKRSAESMIQKRYLSLEEVSQIINDSKAVEKDFRQELKSRSLTRE